MFNQLKNNSSKLKNLTKLTSLFLAAIMIITSTPVQAHAEVTNTGGNTGAGKVTHGAGTDYMGWFRQTRGFRFYIVKQ